MAFQVREQSRYDCIDGAQESDGGRGTFGGPEGCQGGADDDLEHEEGIDHVIADGVLELDFGFLVDGAFVDTLVRGGTGECGIGAKDGG